MSNPKVRLTRESIAAAALEIADKEGFSALSMRRVARELGVGTMSLYYYVKTKDDLMAVMDDALMGEALLPSVPRDPKKAMLQIARSTHAVFTRHPWALVAMLSAAPGPNAMRHIEQCLEALAGTSLTTKQKITLLANVDDFVFGYALRQSARDPEIDLELGMKLLATGEFPRLAEAFGGGRVEASKDRFERGLRAILDSAL